MTLAAARESRARPTLTRVREATKSAHETLEARVDLMGRLRNRADYVRLLSADLGFYAPLEAALADVDWSAIGLDFDSRRKVPLLEADLSALGLDPAARAGLPRCAKLPRLGSLPRGLGALYVVEGATLGGQLIARHVAATLGDAVPLHFYRGYGADNGARWRDFQLALEAGCQTPQDRDDAAGTALALFQALDLWLAQHG